MSETSDLIGQFVQELESVVDMGVAFLRDVLQLIQAIGYTIVDGDQWAVGFCVQKVEQEIKNACNVQSVPDGLYQCATGLVVADFLNMKRAGGNLDVESLSFEPVIKAIQEGDTQINYATDTALSGEQRLNLFLAACYQGREQFVGYRKIKW